jgi:pyridoxine/pyridoxamine 5'-phosphate oxidase
MTQREPFETIARRIIDQNLYMTIGTADGSGTPWVSPVYYAPAEYSEFFWVSRPEARHSRNIEVRPQVSIVIFDSRTPIKTGQAVYMAGLAHQVPDEDLERSIDVFSRRSVAHGAAVWTTNDVAAHARLRLYGARVSEQFALGPHDDRVPIRL